MDYLVEMAFQGNLVSKVCRVNHQRAKLVGKEERVNQATREMTVLLGKEEYLVIVQRWRH
jgi:hypothetical protein